MTRNDLYDYLQSQMPTIQFVNPYLETDPLPRHDVDFATMNIIGVDDRGWAQTVQTGYDESAGTTSLRFDTQRIYRVQIDFYGPNAFENATAFKQTLQVNLAKQKTTVDLKSMSGIRNLTSLDDSKQYNHRYSFDVEVFLVDSITQSTPVIETAKITIVNRGNNQQ